MQCLFQNILCLMFLSVALSLAILRLPSIVHAYLTILWTCRQCTLRVMPVILNGISRYFDHLPVSPGFPFQAYSEASYQRLEGFPPSSRPGTEKLLLQRARQ